MGEARKPAGPVPAADTLRASGTLRAQLAQHESCATSGNPSIHAVKGSLARHETISMSTETPENPSHEKFRRIATLGQAFRPGTPVDTQDLFAGRTKQMNELLQSILQPHTHAIVFGERGVGKTSLVTVVGAALPHIAKAAGLAQYTPHVVRENCASGDTFSTIWRRALNKCPLAVLSRRVGFSDKEQPNVDFSTAASLLPQEDLAPGTVIATLKQSQLHIVFILDEFDRVDADIVAEPLADLIKSLTDHHVAATVIVVGVGDSVTDLIQAHRSIERCVQQVHMPRMTDSEMMEILDKGSKIAGVRFDEVSRRQIASLARGFPHYVHLLGMEAVRAAILRDANEVTHGHLALSLREAMQRSHRSLSDTYLLATRTPQKNTIHRHVLLACVLADTDDQGYFRPADLQKKLELLLKRSSVKTGAYQRHLQEFSSETRGNILKRVGVSRNHRYRFSDTLIIPYILVKGIEEGLIGLEDLGIIPPQID